ncbi:hypothetical protein EV586_104209 [Tumebacillus sp. BK434]|uniref:hypothetical protein n=1 Tax=Tumebacillus sp. BK434 TaxID=2512169 RepID=UPI00104DB5EB|nr:hypothetical protein [Tumebacillus sp. BK434]TCP54588.1 hypothetical protein EV586_104209 [Tumebacillus sp. BK434]
MSESNTYYIKQVWRQKGDALFERISFKEENKAQELSQTTRPVLLLETKANSGSNAVFAIGHVTEPVVIAEEMTYPGQTGEFSYHVPFTYDVVLESKQNGITRDELQELTGQKFAPQVKGGLYEIEAAAYEQLASILNERAGQAPAAKKAPAKAASEAKKAPAEKTATAVNQVSSAKAVSAAANEAAAVNVALADELIKAVSLLEERGELRLVVEGGKVDTFPAALLAMEDLSALQAEIHNYLTAGGHAAVDAAAAETAAAGAASTRYAKVIKLAESLVRAGNYASVQIPTVQKAFYRGDAKLPHPYHAIELQGARGHHILGTDGTLYTAEGKVVQHFLGL